MRPLQKRFEKEAARDVLPMAERFGQLVGIVFIVIFVLYFLSLLSMNTGFFKSNFGAPEAALFFGVAIFGMFPALSRFIFGRRNKVRPLDLVNNVLVIIAGMYFLSTWPFDFSHVADALPIDIQFIIAWLSDPFMQILVIIVIIALLTASIIEMFTYFGVKRILEEPSPQPAAEPTQPPQ
ncbi:MAG: hypothetical protein QXY98_02395 [Thermoplasmata archaeon]